MPLLGCPRHFACNVERAFLSGGSWKARLHRLANCLVNVFEVPRDKVRGQSALSAFLAGRTLRVNSRGGGRRLRPIGVASRCRAVPFGSARPLSRQGERGVHRQTSVLSFAPRRIHSHCKVPGDLPALFPVTEMNMDNRTTSLVGLKRLSISAQALARTHGRRAQDCGLDRDAPDVGPVHCQSRDLLMVMGGKRQREG